MNEVIDAIMSGLVNDYNDSAADGRAAIAAGQEALAAGDAEALARAEERFIDAARRAEELVEAMNATAEMAAQEGIGITVFAVPPTD